MPLRVFLSQFENLSLISEFVRQAAEEAGLDEAGIYAVDLAVDEACSNIIEHGYGMKPDEKIEICCDVVSGGLRIQIVDTGANFNPEDVPMPDVQLPLEEVRPRGLGLYFMRKLMDEVSFEFGPGRNVLTMVKRLPEPAEG